MKIQLSVIAVCALAVLGRAEDKETLIKTGKRPFDIPKEVASFVQNLVDSDPVIHASYLGLIESTRKEAGSRFSVGPFVAIEWQIPEESFSMTESRTRKTFEGVYLVMRQLRVGGHGGHSALKNVVAQVNAHQLSRGKPDSKQEYEAVLTDNELTLHFDGFVNVEITPVSTNTQPAAPGNAPSARP